MRFKPPKSLQKMMPDLVWGIPGAGEGDVFLTFDDGPTPIVTRWILDELARFGAKATFFCLGKNVELYPDLYRRILSEGHAVGNHTHSHLKGWETKTESYMADVDRAAGLVDGNLFRPPYGRISPGQAELLASRYRIVMWNIISRDYNRSLRPRSCLNNVVKHLRGGDIVVFHDSEKAFRNLRFVLPRTLKYMAKAGITCKTIEL